MAPNTTKFCRRGRFRRKSYMRLVRRGVRPMESTADKGSEKIGKGSNVTCDAIYALCVSISCGTLDTIHNEEFSFVLQLVNLIHHLHAAHTIVVFESGLLPFSLISIQILKPATKRHQDRHRRLAQRDPPLFEQQRHQRPVLAVPLPQPFPPFHQKPRPTHHSAILPPNFQRDPVARFRP